MANREEPTPFLGLELEPDWFQNESDNKTD